MLLRIPDASKPKGNPRPRHVLNFLTRPAFGSHRVVPSWSGTISRKTSGGIARHGQGQQAAPVPFGEVCRMRQLDQYLRTGRPVILKGRASRFLFVTAPGLRDDAPIVLELLAALWEKARGFSVSSPRMWCGIVLPRIWWKTEPIYEVYRSCWATPSISTTQVYTHVAQRTSAPYPGRASSPRLDGLGTGGAVYEVEGNE